MDNMTSKLIALFEARISWENLPTEVKKTRDGWAAYKGATRITRFFFSEQGAINAGLDWDSSDVEVKFRF